MSGISFFVLFILLCNTVNSWCAILFDGTPFIAKRIYGTHFNVFRTSLKTRIALYCCIVISVIKDCDKGLSVSGKK